jgi:phage tail-like protein
MLGLYQPPPGFHFTIKIEDAPPPGKSPKLMAALKMAKAVGYDNSFMEISGLSGTVQTEAIVAGGVNDKVFKVPKGTDFSNLVLKRGLVTLSSDLQDWCEDSLKSTDYKITLKNVTLMLLDNKHTPVKAWKLERAYPVKYEVSGFDAMTGKLMIENIELCYQKLDRDSAIEMLVKANQAAQMASMAAAAMGSVGSLAKEVVDSAASVVTDTSETIASAAKNTANMPADVAKGVKKAGEDAVDDLKDDYDMGDDIKDNYDSI